MFSRRGAAIRLFRAATRQQHTEAKTTTAAALLSVAATSQPQSPAPLEVTEQCAKRLRYLTRQHDAHVVLRVIVDGGGCSGLQYLFELEEWSQPPTPRSLKKSDDVLLEQAGVSVIVDGISLGYMSGAKVDYVEEMISSSFRVLDNPNSEGSCGCGVSFSPKQ